MGWVALGIIGVAAFVVLRLAGMPRALGRFAAVALMLGAAGYALQQHAGQPGHPVTAGADAIEVDPGMTAFRAMILPGDAAVLAASDARLRSGDTTAAVAILQRAIQASPRDATLWTALGSAMTAHDDGQMSPAALFAFRRALQLTPDRPGPSFFLGLAYVQAGDLTAARTAWLRALTLTPRDAPYRVDISGRLALVDEFQAMASGERPVQPDDRPVQP